MCKTVITRVVVLIALLGIPVVVQAQTGTVQGVVVDQVIAESLPGVNVFLEGTTLGAATGADGRFVGFRRWQAGY